MTLPDFRFRVKREEKECHHQPEAGSILRLGRVQLGLTMEESEPLAGASQPTISRWERGESVQCLAYAIRLAQRVPAARAALARMTGWPSPAAGRTGTASRRPWMPFFHIFASPIKSMHDNNL